MDKTWYRRLLWLGLVLSLIATIISGLELSFNVYALSLKRTFNFTQTQVELSASAVITGMAFSFLETPITLIVGYGGTFLITWVCSTFFGLMQWVAANHPQYFSIRPWLLFVFQFLFAWSNTIAFLVFGTVIITRLPKRHSGKLIGVFYTIAGMGKIVYALLMDAVDGNLRYFFCTITFMCTALFGSTYIVLYKVTLESQPYETDKQSDSVNVTNTDKDKYASDCSNEAAWSTTDMLKSGFFHLVFWPSSVVYGCAYACVNNITSVADSMGSQDPMETVYIISVFIAITRLSLGFVFDRYRSFRCGFSMIFVIYTSFCIAMGLLMLAVNSTSVSVAAVFAGIGIGPSCTIPFSIMVLKFGEEHYSIVSGLSYIVMCLVQICLQVTMGILYDTFQGTSDSDVTSCHGQRCFYWSSMIILILTTLALIVHFVNFTALECSTTVARHLTRRKETVKLLQISKSNHCDGQSMTKRILAP